MKSDIKVYTTNGVTYLGTCVKRTLLGMKIENTSSISADTFADYLKAGVMQEILEVNIGKNSDIICRELSRREKLNLDGVVAEMKEAEAMAGEWLVTKVFDDFRRLGK